MFAYVLVGNNPDSKRYVSLKKKACEKAGIPTIPVHLPQSISQSQLEKEVRKLVQNEAVSGLIVQLPLPEGLDYRRILDLITPEKDVDGLSTATQMSMLMPPLTQ